MFINIPCIENTKKENGLYSYELKFSDIIQENKKHIIQNSRLSENNKIDLSGTLAYNNNYYNLFSDKNRLFIFNFQSSDFYIIDQEESYYERKKYFYRTIRDGENIYSLYESKLFNKNLMCIKKNNKIIVVVLQSINHETEIYNKFFYLEKNKRNISYNCKISNDENNFIIYALITIGHYDYVKYSSKFIELQDTSKWIEWFSKH